MTNPFLTGLLAAALVQVAVWQGNKFRMWLRRREMRRKRERERFGCPCGPGDVCDHMMVELDRGTP